MLLFRSLSVGLLGAVLYLVASPPDVESELARQRFEHMQHTATVLRTAIDLKRAALTQQPDVTIVDVAHGVDATTIASLIRVDRTESIVSVDGRAVEGNVAAGAAIAAHAGGAQRYIDVEVATPRDRRRVLVLLH